MNIRSRAAGSSITARVLLLSSGLMLGRLSGFVREWILARQFGTSSDADVFSLAIIFPELLTGILSSVTIGAVIYPWLQAETHHRSIMRQAAALTLRLSAAIFLLLCGLAAARFHDNFATVAVLLVSLLAVFPNAIASVTTAILHYYGRPKVQPVSTLIFNTVVILGMLLCQSVHFAGLIVLAAALLRMGALQLEVRTVFPETESTNPSPPEKRLVFRDFSSSISLVALGQLVPVLIPFIDRVAASFGQIGDVAVLSYAEKLSMIPATLVLTIIPYAAAPEIYRSAENDSSSKLRSYGDRILLITFTLGTLFAAIFSFYALPLSQLVFSYTGLEQISIERISVCLKAYVWILPFTGPFGILSTVILAKGLQRELAALSLQALFVKLAMVVAVVFVGPTPATIGISTALGYLFLTARLYYFYRCNKNFQD